MAEEEKKEEGKGFRVEDRRRFSPEGESRAEDRKPQASGERGQETASQRTDSGDPSDQTLPPLSFSTFVISLSTQALLYLGEIQNPATGKTEKDVSTAKQMIDIIGLLREKTKGNLDPGEEKLMEDVLYDLRMRYVEAVKKG